MFLIGLMVGTCVAFLVLCMLIVGKDAPTQSYHNSSDEFDEGVSYGLMLNRINGAIIATNNDEIIVQYESGEMKRFREVVEE